MNNVTIIYEIDKDNRAVYPNQKVENVQTFADPEPFAVGTWNGFVVVSYHEENPEWVVHSRRPTK